MVYKTVGFHININVSEILYKGNIYSQFIFIHLALFSAANLRLGKLQCHILSLVKHNCVWVNLDGANCSVARQKLQRAKNNLCTVTSSVISQLLESLIKIKVLI